MYFDRSDFFRVGPSTQARGHWSGLVPGSLLVAMLLVLTLGACGNKGVLFLEPDSESRAELEQVRQEINQAAEIPSAGQPEQADDDDDKDKKPVRKPSS